VSGFAVDHAGDGRPCVRLAVRVTPRASRNAITGEREGRLTLKVTAPPVDAAANAAVIALVGEAVKVPKRDVTIISGAHSRSKTLAVAGVTAAEVRHRLSAILGQPA
jgi:uncharacterized protein (TIGR00251 family)